jgi:hypothetical protein
VTTSPLKIEAIDLSILEDINDNKEQKKRKIANTNSEVVKKIDIEEKTGKLVNTSGEEMKMIEKQEQKENIEMEDITQKETGDLSFLMERSARWSRRRRTQT